MNADTDTHDLIRDIARSLEDEHTPREIAVYLPLTVEGVRDIVDEDDEDGEGDEDDDQDEDDDLDHFVVGGGEDGEGGEEDEEEDEEET